MLSGTDWLYAVTYYLQVACVLCYGVFFIKKTISYMLFCVITRTYRQWYFTLTVGSGAALVGVILYLYYTRVRVDITCVTQVWVPIALLFLFIRVITDRWHHRMLE